MKTRKADVIHNDQSQENSAREIRSRQEDGQMVVALARGLEILRAFRKPDEELNNSQLVKITGLTKPSVSRYTFTLMTLGYLYYSHKTGNYKLSPGVVSLAAPYLSRIGVSQSIRPMLQSLADDTRGSVSIAARENLEMVYTTCCKGPGALGLRLDVGSSVSIGTTAQGRAYLSALPKQKRDDLITKIKIEAGEDSAQLEKNIEAGIQQVNDLGYCSAFGEWHPQVNAVAIPISLPGSSEILSVNCGGPNYTITPDLIKDLIGPRLLEIQATLAATTNR